jgi:hypothetical protein
MMRFANDAGGVSLGRIFAASTVIKDIELLTARRTWLNLTWQYPTVCYFYVNQRLICGAVILLVTFFEDCMHVSGFVLTDLITNFDTKKLASPIFFPPDPNSAIS